jgi:hypothetical protein
MQTASYKVCACCRENKPVDLFYIAKNRGLYSYCKPCVAIKARKTYEASFEDRLRLTYVSTKSRSKRIGRQFSITMEDLMKQFNAQKACCYYTGEPLAVAVGRREGKGLSLDRIDSSKGYVKENIVLCSWRVNQMKHKYSCEDFIDICKKVYLFSLKRD